MFRLSTLKSCKRYFCLNYAGIDPDTELEVLHNGIVGDRAYAVFKTCSGESKDRLLFLNERIENLVFSFVPSPTMPREVC